MNQKRFEDLMAAITFAEAGEHAAAKAYMNGTVLTAVGGCPLDKAVLRHAASLCKRVRAGLSILSFIDRETLASECRDVLIELAGEGLALSIAERSGCMRKAIVEYVEKASGVLFVVIGSDMELDLTCDSDAREFAAKWKNLRCPLVLVSDEGTR